jgi:hypothetical protein
MYPGQKEKLERYLRNAERFLWGVIPGDKRAVLTALRAMLRELGEDSVSIPEHRRPTYAMVADNLLAKLGIERIVTQIIAGQVKRELADRPGALDFLRAHWMSGTLPRWQTLQSLRAPRSIKQRLLDAIDTKDARQKRQQTSDIVDAFLEVNAQFSYVHGWTMFAGLWFEEIEPLLKQDTGRQAGSHS